MGEKSEQIKLTEREIEEDQDADLLDENQDPTTVTMKGITHAATEYWPELGRADSKTCIANLIHLHGVWTLFCLVGLGVYIGVLCGYGKLSIDRHLNINMHTIAQSNTSGDAWEDQFDEANHPNVANSPVTVFIILMFGLGFLNHGWQYWNPKLVKDYFDLKVSPFRWIYFSAWMTLLYIILSQFNGENELTDVLDDASAVFGVAAVGFLFEYCIGLWQVGKATKSANNVTVGDDTVLNIGSWVLAIAFALWMVPFLVRIGFNGKATSTWIFGLSITFVIVYGLLFLMYIMWTRRLVKTKFYNGRFAITERYFMLTEAFTLIAFSVTETVKQARI